MRGARDHVKNLIIVLEKMKRLGRVFHWWGKGGVASGLQFEWFVLC